MRAGTKSRTNTANYEQHQRRRPSELVRLFTIQRVAEDKNQRQHNGIIETNETVISLKLFEHRRMRVNTGTTYQSDKMNEPTIKANSTVTADEDDALRSFDAPTAACVPLS